MKIGMWLGVLAGMMLISACDVTTPSQLNVTRIQVQDDFRVETFALAKPDPAKLDDLARAYKEDGHGAMSVLAAYRSGDMQAKARADKGGKKLMKMLAARGVAKPGFELVPVEDSSKCGTAVVSFPVLAAVPPPGCRDITGTRGGESMADDEGYMIGCANQTALSRMIADPKDLLGRDELAKGDARRQGGVVESYKAGTPNELFYNTSSASEIGSQ